MRIERAEMILLPLRLRERFVISSGWTQERHVFLLRLEGGGEVGWSECVAGERPNYSSETTETAWHVMRDFLLPEIVGTELESPEQGARGMEWVRGHRMARAAVEMGLHDLFAKAHGKGLAEWVSGRSRPVEVGVSIGLQPTDAELVEVVRRRLAEGYRKIKIKIKPGRDVEMLSAVREAHPDAPLMADANSAYTLEDLPRLRRLDALELMMVEQPLGHEDLADHARLQAELATPVCLDESIRSPGDARLALQLGSGRIINVKPGRVGGTGPAREIQQICVDHGVDAWVGGMLESGIGRAHNLALATLAGFTLPGDISESRRYWEDDIVRPEFVMREGRMELPPGPGIAVAPDEERIRRLAVRTLELR